MFAILLGFITAFTLSYLAIPPILQVAHKKKLYDAPNERSAHAKPTPLLGGVAIFAGAICGIVLWTPEHTFGGLQHVLAALVIIFLIGIRDDMLPMAPRKKLLGQVLAALILVYKANVKITSLDGILGIQELPELAGFGLSVVAIVGLINAFNLIDGINGLAASTGLLACLTLGLWFAGAEQVEFAVLAFSLAGALVAFLKYNVTPARIFMGDTGAMLTGAVCAVLAIKFIELDRLLPQANSFRLGAAPAIATAVLILPLFDTLWVMTRRFLQGRSLFYPDRSHIHHMLLDTGLSHMQATGILVLLNALIVLWVVALYTLGTNWLLLLELVFALTLAIWLHRHERRVISR